MSFTDEETKRAADTKEWLEAQITELEEQLAKLREALLVVDSVLKRMSFRKAAELPPTAEVEAPAKKEVAPQVSEVRQIRRGKEGPLISNAYVTSTTVSIVPTTDVKLSTSTPPFESFFVNRIIEGMKQKDKDLVEKKQLTPENTLEFSVDEKAGLIEKIVIKNYREKQRLDEIINTITWAFARMLEKKAQ
ncbi:MAG: hypothetical protein HYU02_06145 [Thaumarchaeota archaeon]|nr:hypothetical protein [Nitrososphaerota archaeon]